MRSAWTKANLLQGNSSASEAHEVTLYQSSAWVIDCVGWYLFWFGTLCLPFLLCQLNLSSIKVSRNNCISYCNISISIRLYNNVIPVIERLNLSSKMVPGRSGKHPSLCQMIVQIKVALLPLPCSPHSPVHYCLFCGPSPSICWSPSLP